MTQYLEESIRHFIVNTSKNIEVTTVMVWIGLSLVEYGSIYVIWSIDSKDLVHFNGMGGRVY